jgi:diacylglycerol kinase (ATP)
MTTDTKPSVPEEVAAMPAQSHRALRRGSWRIAGDLPASFRYAGQGLGYAFITQRNFRIHVIIGAVVFSLGMWLQLDLTRMAVLVLTVAAVLVLELLNTAIEAVVDLAIGRRFHPLARIAKDCAAASVLVAAISSLLIALFLLMPPLMLRLGL